MRRVGRQAEATLGWLTLMALGLAAPAAALPPAAVEHKAIACEIAMLPEPEMKNRFNLHLFTHPAGARVFIDGIDTKMRTTLTNYRWSLGKHTVRLVYRDGRQHAFELDVKSPVTVMVNCV